MAKAPAAPQADAAVVPPVRSKKLLVIILAAVVGLLVILAAVFALFMMKKGGNDEAKGAEAAASTVDLNNPPTFISLEPFVVNLDPAEGERYLQVVLALRVKDAKTGDSLKGFMPAIRHTINLVLSSKLPSELATLEGREDLALEIVEEANIALGFQPGRDASKSPIEAVMFNSFIIQ